MTGEENPMDVNRMLARGMDIARADVAARPTILDDVLAGARRRRRRHRVVLTLAAGLVTVTALAGVAAIQQDGEPPAQVVLAGPTTTPSTPAVPLNDPSAVVALRERAPLPSCGTYRLGQDQTPDPAAGACLAAALRSPDRGAELVVSRPSIAGDPILTYYRDVPGSPDLEVFIDAPPDLFAPQNVFRLTCTDFIATSLAVTGCSGPQQSGVPTAVDPASARTLIAALHAFAAAPGPETFSQLPLAPQVQLGLGTQLLRTVRASDLADPAAWVVKVGPKGYAGREGTFNILEFLDAPTAYQLVLGAQTRPCTSVPRPAPKEVADLLRVSTSPVLAAFCLEFSTVDLFVRDGVVAAITLGLGAP